MKKLDHRVLASFNKAELLSGNLNSESVKKLARRYGFPFSLMPIINDEGTHIPIKCDELDTVKKNRNELAHGTFSFKECGKNYTLEQLIEIKDHVIEYLRQILGHIEQYIVDEKYLAANAS